jgi:hypothetical protein
MTRLAVKSARRAENAVSRRDRQSENRYDPYFRDVVFAVVASSIVLADATAVVATGMLEAWLGQDAQQLQHEQLVVSSCFEPTVRGIGLRDRSRIRQTLWSEMTVRSRETSLLKVVT